MNQPDYMWENPPPPPPYNTPFSVATFRRLLGCPDTMPDEDVIACAMMAQDIIPCPYTEGRLVAVGIICRAHTRSSAGRVDGYGPAEWVRFSDEGKYWYGRLRGIRATPGNRIEAAFYICGPYVYNSSLVELRFA